MKRPVRFQAGGPVLHGLGRAEGESLELAQTQPLELLEGLLIFDAFSDQINELGFPALRIKRGARLMLKGSTIKEASRTSADVGC